MKGIVTVISSIIIVFLFCLLTGCDRAPKLFERIPASSTGVDFVNKVEENEKYNVLDYMNIYTGAGVAAGDINNDGLTDLYFAGNQNSGRLYINRGHFKFEDITESAGLTTDRWCTGVSMVDINQDGFQDIYVSVAGSPKLGNTANLLYINKGNETFSEQAESYGIADPRLCMQASFFDYDKDHDLDLFLTTNPADQKVENVNVIKDILEKTEVKGADILYRNNGNGTFTDVSLQAGITKDGYSLGSAISDINLDGWPDIFVSNDFVTSDILYINNGDGTFTDKIGEVFKHSSFASMGNDIADFNNDGLPDVYVVDMLPEDNYRKKMIIPAASYDKFQLLISKGYEPQYTRNTLQINNGNGTFSDIAFMSGVSATDWSWSTLFGDYDCDGDKDLFVANGFYRDLGDLDYISYQARIQNPMGSQNAKHIQKLAAINNLSKIPLQDYLFENNADLTFKKKSIEWGLSEAGFSNGACYADLDNDGDLELIISQFNDVARIYKNNAMEQSANQYLKIKLEGIKPNRQGIGAKIWLYTKSGLQYQELSPYRGYESSMEPILYFGVSQATVVDSVAVEWLDGAKQTEYAIQVNQLLTIKYKKSARINAFHLPLPPSLMKRVNIFTDAPYRHIESEFNDFKTQPLLPHMHSRSGPGISVGDINNDGADDFYVGGSAGFKGSFFVQKENRFVEKKMNFHTDREDTGVLLFDADNDNDLDLYVVSGGSEYSEGTIQMQDRLYKNDGKGNFTYDSLALPNTTDSGSCVVANDFDKDGDLDLFVGSRLIPGEYPVTPKSYLLKNEKGIFRDMSSELPNAGKLGMVSSALWTDYDNDGWFDLLVVGEFMPITFIKNDHGRLNKNSIVPNSNGWWNSITAGDYDEDGDIDYMIGNLGLNTRCRASAKEPFSIYAKDFDKNGRIDPVLVHYIQGKEYLFASRDDMIKQINAFRGRFQSYKHYASTPFKKSFNPDELNEALHLMSNRFESTQLINLGNGNFQMKALPLEAQKAPLFGMTTDDIDDDGHLDLLLTGNSYPTEASTGRYDAMTGLVLKGDGNGSFLPITCASSGFRADKDSKGLAKIDLKDGRRMILVGTNNDELEAYQLLINPTSIVRLKNTDAYWVVKLSNGKSYKREIYRGDSYLSASSACLPIGSRMASITVVDTQGKQREIKLKHESFESDNPLHSKYLK